MKSLRYVLSFVISCILIYLVIILSGGSLLTYIDLPSLILVLALPICMLRFGWSFTEMKNIFSSIFSSKPEKKILANAACFFNTMSKYFIFSGIVGVFIGLIAIMKNLEDPKMLGPNLAVAMITILYGSFFSLTVAIPLAAMSKKQLNELE